VTIDKSTRTTRPSETPPLRRRRRHNAADVVRKASVARIRRHRLDAPLGSCSSFPRLLVDVLGVVPFRDRPAASLGIMRRSTATSLSSQRHRHPSPLRLPDSKWKGRARGCEHTWGLFAALHQPQSRIRGDRPGRVDDREVTVFDSVGFAIEDFTALHYVQRATAASRFSEPIALIIEPDNPKDLYGMVGAPVLV
jgi:hypothetical protein